MNEQITKEQINTTIALALMKHLYCKFRPTGVNISFETV